MNTPAEDSIHEFRQLKYGGRELPLKIFKFLGISFVIFFLILIYVSFFFLK